MSTHTTSHEHFAQSPDEQVDPHGFAKGHHHGHVILSIFTLRSVLAALLLFTALTVFCAQGERIIESLTGVVFPHWVNVAVAMSIATVKSIIVAAYFMQLKYDNPINTVIMLFCLFALSLFLGFTALDLGGRGEVLPFKSGEIQAGGLGGLDRHERIDGKEEKVAISGPLYEFPAQHLKERLREKLAAEYKDPARLDAAVDAEFEKIREEVMAHGHGHRAAPEPTGNSPDRSRPRKGLTPGLFGTAPEAGEASGHGSH